MCSCTVSDIMYIKFNHTPALPLTGSPQDHFIINALIRIMKTARNWVRQFLSVMVSPWCCFIVQMDITHWLSWKTIIPYTLEYSCSIPCRTGPGCYKNKTSLTRHPRRIRAFDIKTSVSLPWYPRPNNVFYTKITIIPPPKLGRMDNQEGPCQDPW